MVEATFKVPAPEFTAEFIEQIRPFLRDSEAEVFVQVRRKAKRSRKNGVLPKPPNGTPKTDLNSETPAGAEVFVKKYPLQPTPEEADRLLAKMLTTQAQHHQRTFEERIREKTRDWKPVTHAEWDKLAAALDIEESAEELIALLTK
jgi:hypothetical protein